jgi:hypothetical protein
MLMWARGSCPSWRVGLAGLVLACSLLCAAATSAAANGPLGGQQVSVAAVQATVQTVAAPATATVDRTAATVRRTAERSAAAAPAAPTAVVQQAPAVVPRTATTTLSQPAPAASAKPATGRKTTRHRRGGAAVAKAAVATPAPGAKRFPVSRPTVTPVTEPATALPQLQRSLSPRPDAPRRSERAASVAPAEDSVPAPAATSSAAAASASGSAAGATALLTLLSLVAFAASRFGSLLRLPEAIAPMPPLLAIPERPG